VPKTAREVIKALRAAGWVEVRVRGSHRQLRHPENPNVITVAGPPRTNGEGRDAE
jgi:predicted RNA binding protein YcfA (HicA-like mRNA interferase family)